MPKKIGAVTYAEMFQGSDYTTEEWDFIRAVWAYQKRWQRRYPSWREVLFVLKSLGYRKVAAPQEFAEPRPGERERLQLLKREAPSVESPSP